MLATVQQRSSKDDCELPRPQRVDSPFALLRQPPTSSGGAGPAVAHLNSNSSGPRVGAGGPLQLQLAGQSAPVTPQQAHLITTGTMSPSADARAGRSKRVAFAPNTPDNERLRAEAQPHQQLPPLQPYLQQQQSTNQNPNQIAAESANIYEVPRVQPQLRGVAAAVGVQPLGHEAAAGRVSVSPLDRRRKHTASAGVPPRANDSLGGSPTPMQLPNQIPNSVQMQVQMPMPMQLAAIATPEQSRAWRWTRNNSVEHELLPPLPLLPALQQQQQLQQQSQMQLAPVPNGAECARYNVRETQKQSEPPVYCRMPSGALPAPSPSATVVLPVTRVEEMSGTAPQIVTAPLDKTLVDLLVLIGMPHVIRILERYGIASLASLEREAAGGALSRIPAHVVSESERAKLSMAAEILAASRGSSASASASSPSTSASSQPSRLAQVDAPSGGRSGSGSGSGSARKPKENPFCTPLLSRARPPRLASVAVASGAQLQHLQSLQSLQGVQQQQQPHPPPPQQPNISPTILQNLHNEFVALNIGSGAAQHQHVADADALAIALSQRSIPARPDAGEGERSQWNPRALRDFKNGSVDDDLYMNSCSVLLPSPDLPDLPDVRDDVLDMDSLSPSLPPPPPPLGHSESESGPNAVLDGPLPHRRTSGGASPYEPHRQMRSQSESRHSHSHTRADLRALDDSEDASLSPSEETRQWLQSQTPERQERRAHVATAVNQQQQQQSTESARGSNARGWVCYASFGPETAPAALVLPSPPPAVAGAQSQSAGSSRRRQSSQCTPTSTPTPKQKQRQKQTPGQTQAQKTRHPAGPSPPPLAPVAHKEGSSDSPSAAEAETDARGRAASDGCGAQAPLHDRDLLDNDNDDDDEAALVLGDARGRGRWNGDGDGGRCEDVIGVVGVVDEVDDDDDDDTRASSPVFVPRSSSDDSGSRGRGQTPRRATGREVGGGRPQDTHPSHMHAHTKLSATLREHFDTGDSVFDRI